jgi:RNA-directed DNA polymerase
MMHGQEKSDPAIVAAKSANKAGRPGAERMEPRAGAEGNAGEPHTVRAQCREAASPGIARIRQAAKDRKGEKLTTLLHHIDVALLEQAYHWLKRDAAAGVDGMTWADYGEGLSDRLADLHDRVHRGAYRAQPSRRTDIPKPDGRQRPLGNASPEDKIVQRALVEVLVVSKTRSAHDAIYETDFLGF